MKTIFNKNQEDNHDFWMSYTDLMSAFLIVFIILSAILYNYYMAIVSEVDEFQMYSQSVEKESNDLKNLIQQFEDVFPYDEEVAYKIDVNRGSIILTNRNPELDLFAQSNEVIMRPALDRYLHRIGKDLIAKAIKINKLRGNRGIEVRIEGHTDPTWDNQRGSDYGYIKNLQLSSDRANAVYSYIFEQCDLTDEQKAFAKKNMISIGYSFSTREIEENINNEALDPQSRRIEFRIISK